VLNTRSRFRFLCTDILLAAFGLISSAHGQSTPVSVGYRDFNFGSTVISFPTAEKPESKLWWNDGYWWGTLWSPGADAYRIHRLEPATQSWVDVGPDIDDRPGSLGDALWDGQKLYIASHIYGGRSQQSSNTTAALSARLYRYSYNSSTNTYSLDSGFPVLVNNAQSETLVLEKDSNGKLWVTWTQAKRVYVNRSLGDDLTWGTPFVLPVQGSNLDSDDISSVIAFGNNKIGVIWSNQADLKCYFAFHLDSNADTDWEPRETALADANLGAVADDHLNLKMMADGGGTIYCITKTSLGNSNAPAIYMLRRNSSGVWSKFVVAMGSEDYTRAILVIDEENRELYAFAKSDNSTPGTIRMKKTSLDNPAFPPGLGSPFIMSSSERDINDPTASKHNVNSTTGLLILASDATDRYYMHNYITLAGNGRPTLSSFTPASGPPGTAVTITGSNFTGASAVRFNGSSANFTVDSDAQITATVPSAATTGRIEVTNSAGTSSSATNFSVLLPPSITSFTPASGPVGTQVTITGNNFAGATDVTFNGASAATFTVNSNTEIRADVPSGATTGVISATNAAGSASSASVFTVTTATSQYTLAVNTIGSGSVGMNPSGGIYDAGTVVMLTASPSSGWQFSGWSGDLTGSNNPGTITMDADKNVTATFTASGSSGQVAHEETRTGGSSDSRTVTTSANLIAANGELYLAAISTKPKIAANNVTGLGLTWTLVQNQCSGRNNTGIEVWMAQGTPGGDGAVTATLASAAKNAVIVVSRYSGVATTSPIGEVVSGNTNGVNGSCFDGVNTRSYALNLTTSAGGAVAYGAVAMRMRTHTPGAGYTERGEFTQVGSVTGNAAGVAVQDKSVASPSAVIVDGRFNSLVDWAAVALEIRPQPGGGGTTQNTLTVSTVGSGSVNLNPPGGVYDAGSTVTLTASPASGWQFSGWSGDLTGTNSPATITMDDDKDITATFTQLSVTQYALTVNTAGSGSVVLNPPGGVYDAGTAVTLTASPASGWQFSGWSGDLSGASNPATITMDDDRDVTATFTAMGGSGQVVHQETRTSGSSSSITVATSASLTGVSGDLYLAAVAVKPNIAVNGITGLGLNWTRLQAQCAGRNQTGVEIWMAMGSPSGNGTVTATLVSTPSNAVIAVSRYSGVDATNPIGNIVSGNTNGAGGSCSDGTDDDSYSLDLNAAVAGAMVYGAASMRNRTHTPGAGYFERGELMQSSGSGGSAAAIAVEDRIVAAAGTVVVNGTFSGSVDWAVVAVEIKPQLTMGKPGANSGQITLAFPVQFELEPNYPNPFNPGTSIDFSLLVRSNVRLGVYDLNGRLVHILGAGDMAPGRHSVRWDGNDQFNRPVAAGIYLYRLEARGEGGDHLFTQTRRMILLK
jgi:uncharacterized repeat protein (TIGR02543 family)